MRILIVNDDGMQAAQLPNLIRWARNYGEVTAFVPKFEQSGKSHSFIMNRDIEVRQERLSDDITIWSVDATPADCVRFAVLAAKMEFDLCISSAPPEDTFDNSTCLITERLMLVVSREHPLARKDCVSFSECKEENFALISRKTELWQQTLLQSRQAGFSPRVAMVCGDLHCLIKYVGAGMGVTLGPEISWQSLKNDSVVFLPTNPAVSRSTYVFWNGSKNQSRLCTAYREYLVNYFSQKES